jgi:hypothetical protein
MGYIFRRSFVRVVYIIIKVLTIVLQSSIVRMDCKRFATFLEKEEFMPSTELILLYKIIMLPLGLLMVLTFTALFFSLVWLLSLLTSGEKENKS